MKQLGQLEADVMRRLWTAGRPTSVREVLEDISQERPLAYTTVMTVLDNLHSKGFVRRTKQGRAFVYSPVMSREEHTVAMLQEVLAGSDDRAAALMRLVDRMPPAEAADLLAALQERMDGPT